MLRDAPAENRSAVRDPLWKHVYVDDALSEALLSAPFMRLTRILQLGPTHLVYPGATHTRAAHSIGVYSVACRLLDVLRARGARGAVSRFGSFPIYPFAKRAAACKS